MIEFQRPAADNAHSLRCELASEVLRSSGTLRLRVTGWSMLPTVMPGDTLIVDQVSGEVSRGDIVLVSRNQRLFAHRVVSTPSGQQDHVITQGDGMARPDPPVAPFELLGRVSHIVRNGRCLEPGKKLGVSSRAVSEMVRRSDSAARIFVGVHGMRGHVAERLGFQPRFGGSASTAV